VPTAQAQYKEILNKIASATQDELLEDDASEMPRLYSQSAGCIAAQGSRTFGTNRLPENVEADYSKAFSPWVFQSDETPAGFKMIGAGTETTGVQVIFIDPISPDFSVGKGKYRTIYRVQIVYADPARDGCFG
jgi:hypothetical protein